VKVALDPGATTLYDRLSDGEHQLVQIAGALALFGGENTLFILDEPESHLNPVWRAEFVEIISKLLPQGGSSADVIISTHSPFVGSGCKRQDVMKFSKQQGVVTIERPTEETYGASFDYLLNALFDMGALLASKPAGELQGILARANVSELEAAIRDFGGSMEKAAVFARLSDLQGQKG
jgi:ABC-type glutathione transport system ATPase component